MNTQYKTKSSSSEIPSLVALRQDFVAMFKNDRDILSSETLSSRRSKYTTDTISCSSSERKSGSAFSMDREMRRQQQQNGYRTPEICDGKLANHTGKTASTAKKIGDGSDMSGGGDAEFMKGVKTAAKVILYNACVDSLTKHGKLLKNLKLNPQSASAWIDLIENLNEERIHQSDFKKASLQVVKDMRKAVIKLYTTAIDTVPMTPMNRHLPAYLKLWTGKALTIAQDEKEREVAAALFQKMKELRIGLNYPQLYESWAYLEGLRGRIHLQEARLKEAAFLRWQNDKSTDPNTTPRTPLSIPIPGSAMKSATKRLKTPRSGLPLRPPQRVPIDNPSTVSSESSTPRTHIAPPSAQTKEKNLQYADSPEVFRSANPMQFERLPENQRTEHPMHCSIDLNLKENWYASNKVQPKDSCHITPVQAKNHYADLPIVRTVASSERTRKQRINATPTPPHESSQREKLNSSTSHPSTPSYLNNALEGTLSKFGIKETVSPNSPWSDVHARGSNHHQRSGSPKIESSGGISASTVHRTREESPKLRVSTLESEGYGLLGRQRNSPDSKKYSKKGASLSRTPSREMYSAHKLVTVNGKEYMKLGTVGRGGSSEVYKILSLSDNKIYALKKVDIARASQAAFESYKNEIDLLRKLSGKPTIIELVDWEISDPEQSIFLVLEYGEIDLAQILQRKENGHSYRQSYRQAFYWQQMLEAVHTIHQEKIFHGDLKPANFLLVKDTLKLIDFGIAKAIVNDDTTKIIRSAAIGTPNYMSPEALREEQFPDDGDSSAGESSRSDEYHRRAGQYKVSRSSDIWSLGCILYQMTYGRAPFAHIKNLNQKMRCIMDPNYKIKYKEVHDKNLLNVLQGCLQRNPAKRMTMDQLLEHPYVRPHAESVPQSSNRETIEKVLKVLRDMNIELSPESVAAKIGSGTEEILQQVTHTENRKAIHFPDRLPMAGCRVPLKGANALAKSNVVGHLNPYRTPTSSLLTNSGELKRDA